MWQKEGGVSKTLKKKRLWHHLWTAPIASTQIELIYKRHPYRKPNVNQMKIWFYSHYKRKLYIPHKRLWIQNYYILIIDRDSMDKLNSLCIIHRLMHMSSSLQAFETTFGSLTIGNIEFKKCSLSSMHCSGPSDFDHCARFVDWSPKTYLNPRINGFSLISCHQCHFFSRTIVHNIV